MKTQTRIVDLTQLVKEAMPKVAMSLGMALLIALSAHARFYTPFTPVPVTLQVAAVLFAGFALGPRWGAFSVIQYFALGFAGAPVFAMASGPAAIFAPSFGYLAAFLPAAWLTGQLASINRKNLVNGILIALAGVAVIYIGGSMWLAGYFYASGLTVHDSLVAAYTQGIAPFIVVDLIKAILVGGAFSLVRRQ